MTYAIQCFTQQKLQTIGSVAGYVVATKSPSCGFNSVPLKSSNGRVLSSNSSGLFTNALEVRFPGIPIIEEISLGSWRVFLTYQIRVITYHKIINSGCVGQNLISQLLGMKDKTHIPQGVANQMSLLSNGLKSLELARLNELLHTLRDSIHE